ncbi:Endoplasmic reticulum transmembrane protein 3 [Lecanicillium sp. MT-2017a]|nr:Endoplasmic reticulum transmembrane protein 3 [Lecanicillium sp. MT-2017a]
MTLYFSLVFGILVFEMALFMLLVVPLPFKVKRKIFTFISENPIVAKGQYWMKIVFVFILILFIDSVNRVYRVQQELSIATDKMSSGAAVMGHERLEVQVRKFYSQRNMYLCGFTLFLSLILNRTFLLILDVMRLEDRLRTYEGDGGSKKESEKLGAAGKPGEIAGLREELAKKDQDLKNLKKQSEQLHKSYNELSDKYEATQASEPNKEK